MAADGRIVGRKRLTITQDDRQLAWLVRQNRFSSSQDLTVEWNKTGNTISERTTRRRLAELHYKPRVPAVKPLPNAKQRQNVSGGASKEEIGHQNSGHQSRSQTSPISAFHLVIKVPEWRKTGETNLAQCV